MVHPTAAAHYQIPSQALHIPRIDHARLFSAIYSLLTLALGIILVSLGLRILFALFVYDGVLAHSATYLTNPIVAPFGSYFHDTHEMVQASTAATFTSLYAFYWIISLLRRFFYRYMIPYFQKYSPSYIVPALKNSVKT